LEIDREQVPLREKKTKIDQFIDSLVSEALARRTGRRRHVLRSWISNHKILGLTCLVIIGVSAFMIAFPTFSSPLISQALNDSHCSTLSPPHNGSQPSSNRIALVDSLSSKLSDPEFVDATMASAQKAGYEFDYFPANATTVNLFLNLPRMNYKLVIFRTHGSSAVLTTSELYSEQRRVMDQLLDRVGAIDVNGTVYYGLYPKSVTEMMCGRFPGTVILAMGCGGIETENLANAFVSIGARAVIAWDKTVSISHTDSAYRVVIESLLGHASIASSVRASSSEIGPDPVYGASLHYYPENQGQFSF
jgi:hypothetical protein